MNIYKKRISSLGLSKTTVSLLQQSHYDTVGDLMSYIESNKDLTLITGITPECASEIGNALYSVFHRMYWMWPEKWLNEVTNRDSLPC